MATYSGYLMVGLPDNPNATQLLVASGLTSSGTFTLASTLDYEYPTRTVGYSIDEDRWYKVAFQESATSWVTPYSDPIAGAQILKAIPSLAITSSYDGVSSATAQDVYDVSNMTSADASESDVNYALSMARSFIDLRMSSVDKERFDSFSCNVARRKYNAVLRLLKDVEINFALSLIYRNLADDAIMAKVTAGTKTSTSIAVGQTALGGITGSDTVDTATYLDALSTRYANYATSLLDTLTPNYVPLRYSENGTGYRLQFIKYSVNNTAYFNFADGIILDRMDL